MKKPPSSSLPPTRVSLSGGSSRPTSRLKSTRLRPITSELLSSTSSTSVRVGGGKVHKKGFSTDFRLNNAHLKGTYPGGYMRKPSRFKKGCGDSSEMLVDMIERGIIKHEEWGSVTTTGDNGVEHKDDDVSFVSVFSGVEVRGITKPKRPGVGMIKSGSSTEGREAYERHMAEMMDKYQKELAAQANVKREDYVLKPIKCRSMEDLVPVEVPVNETERKKALRIRELQREHERRREENKGRRVGTKPQQQQRGRGEEYGLQFREESKDTYGAEYWEGAENTSPYPPPASSVGDDSVLGVGLIVDQVGFGISSDVPSALGGDATTGSIETLRSGDFVKTKEDEGGRIGTEGGGGGSNNGHNDNDVTDNNAAATREDVGDDAEGGAAPKVSNQQQQQQQQQQAQVGSRARSASQGSAVSVLSGSVTTAPRLNPPAPPNKQGGSPDENNVGRGRYSMSVLGKETEVGGKGRGGEGGVVLFVSTDDYRGGDCGKEWILKARDGSSLEEVREAVREVMVMPDSCKLKVWVKSDREGRGWQILEDEIGWRDTYNMARVRGRDILIKAAVVGLVGGEDEAFGEVGGVVGGEVGDMVERGSSAPATESAPAPAGVVKGPLPASPTAATALPDRAPHVLHVHTNTKDINHHIPAEFSLEPTMIPNHLVKRDQETEKHYKDKLQEWQSVMSNTGSSSVKSSVKSSSAINNNNNNNNNITTNSHTSSNFSPYNSSMGVGEKGIVSEYTKMLSGIEVDKRGGGRGSGGGGEGGMEGVRDGGGYHNNNMGGREGGKGGGDGGSVGGGDRGGLEGKRTGGLLNTVMGASVRKLKGTPFMEERDRRSRAKLAQLLEEGLRRKGRKKMISTYEKSDIMGGTDYEFGRSLEKFGFDQLFGEDDDNK
ncbi:hypothetical protein TrCOL_g13192 [Triparma columacea]|uniref:Uncharacterized protein n=1 Tax=Triparma columacea TaxID=722753 RepID=A0A9W7G8I6_9STRA|nr:hypothetical protein TrCOL_g13192 [Triparma columacea]